jgi:hypothetical protein
MGTNFYHESGDLTARCTKCGQLCDDCNTRVHIGKSSAGWTFSFHATETIKSYADWLRVLSSDGRIVDDCGRVVSLDEFKAMIAEKATAPKHHTRYCDQHHTSLVLRGDVYTDPEGHSFSEGEFS